MAHWNMMEIARIFLYGKPEDKIEAIDFLSKSPSFPLQYLLFLFAEPEEVALEAIRKLISFPPEISIPLLLSIIATSSSLQEIRKVALQTLLLYPPSTLGLFLCSFFEISPQTVSFCTKFINFAPQQIQELSSFFLKYTNCQEFMLPAFEILTYLKSPIALEQALENMGKRNPFPEFYIILMNYIAETGDEEKVKLALQKIPRKFLHSIVINFPQLDHLFTPDFLEKLPRKVRAKVVSALSLYRKKLLTLTEYFPSPRVKELSEPYSIYIFLYNCIQNRQEERAIETLNSSPSLQKLLPLFLTSKRRFARLKAIRILSRDPQNNPLLFPLLEQEDEDVVREILSGLCEREDESILPFVPRFFEKDAFFIIFNCLPHFKDREIRRRIAFSLTPYLSSSPFFQIAFWRALKFLKVEDFVQEALVALDSPHFQVSFNASSYLVTINAQKFAPVVLQKLPPVSFPSFISDHPFVIPYISTELFVTLPASVQKFLVEKAIEQGVKVPWLILGP